MRSSLSDQVDVNVAGNKYMCQVICAACCTPTPYLAIMVLCVTKHAHMRVLQLCLFKSCSALSPLTSSRHQTYPLTHVCVVQMRTLTVITPFSTAALMTTTSHGLTLRFPPAQAWSSAWVAIPTSPTGVCVTCHRNALLFCLLFCPWWATLLLLWRTRSQVAYSPNHQEMHV